MSNDLGAWLLVFVLPLLLSWAAAVGWKETLLLFRGRIRGAVASVNAEKKEIETILRQANAQLQTQQTQIEALFAQTYPDTPGLMDAINGTSRREREELAHAISVWRSQDAQLAREKARDFESRLSEMSTLWLDENSKENPCTELLCKNLWSLGPDLRDSKHIFFDRGQDTIVDNYFPGDRFSPAPKFTSKTDYRPDAAGVFYRRTELTRDGNNEQKVFVIVEAKAPSEEVTQSVMDEAFQYALNLRRMSKTLSRWDIECFALAGKVNPKVRSQLFRIGQTHHTITVTPITWAALLNRAQSLNPEHIDLGPIDLNGVPQSYVERSDDEVFESRSLENDQALEEVVSAS